MARSSSEKEKASRLAPGRDMVRMREDECFANSVDFRRVRDLSFGKKNYDWPMRGYKLSKGTNRRIMA